MGRGELRVFLLCHLGHTPEIFIFLKIYVLHRICSSELITVYAIDFKILKPKKKKAD